MPTGSGTSRTATLSGLLAIVLWSTTIASSRSVAEQLGTFTGGALVYLAAGLLGNGGMLVGGRMSSLRQPANRRYLVVCGSLMVLYTVLLYSAIGLAERREQMVAITLANYLWPSFTLWLAIPLLGWRVRPATLTAGSLLSVAGIALVLDIPQRWRCEGAWEMRDLAPIAMALGAALTWAAYSNLARRWADRQSGGAMPLFLLAAGASLLALRFLTAEDPRWTARSIGEAVYLAVFPTLLAYTLWDVSVRRGDLALIGAASYLTPVLSMVVSAWHLGIVVPAAHWLAGLLVVLGAVLSKRGVQEP